MSKKYRGFAKGKKFAATDLDGTLIPLDGHPTNQRDLHSLKDAVRENQFAMMFVTGRHFESVMHAIEKFDLPLPEWIICDVGTSIHKLRSPSTSTRAIESRFEISLDYVAHLRKRVGPNSTAALQDQLTSVSGIRLQEKHKQGQFKLSYYANAEELDDSCSLIQAILSRHQLPWSIIASVDPFNGDGLIDLLPAGCSKAFALEWLMRIMEIERRNILFAGDSGNDFAVLTSGLPAIVVGNADRQLARRVHDEHVRQGWKNRLFLAPGQATSGVLQGVRWFWDSCRDADEL